LESGFNRITGRIFEESVNLSNVANEGCLASLAGMAALMIINEKIGALWISFAGHGCFLLAIALGLIALLAYSVCQCIRVFSFADAKFNGTEPLVLRDPELAYVKLIKKVFGTLKAKDNNNLCGARVMANSNITVSRNICAARTNARSHRGSQRRASASANGSSGGKSSDDPDPEDPPRFSHQHPATLFTHCDQKLNRYPVSRSPLPAHGGWSAPCFRRRAL
jgi:hypothetical protein